MASMRIQPQSHAELIRIDFNDNYIKGDLISESFTLTLPWTKWAKSLSWVLSIQKEYAQDSDLAYLFGYGYKMKENPLRLCHLQRSILEIVYPQQYSQNLILESSIWVNLII